MSRLFDPQAEFARLNRKYFRSSLPRDTIIRWIRRDDLMGACYIKPPTIMIHTGLRRWPKSAEMTMLHEMAHISSGDTSHGKRWLREMRRLVSAGAFDSLW